jgi:hypothetical protein
VAEALGLPTIFIRYNPDSYKTASGSSGHAVPATREQTLIRWLKYLLSAKSEAIIAKNGYLSVIYLYYDGWVKSEAACVEKVPHPEFEKASASLAASASD